MLEPKSSRALRKNANYAHFTQFCLDFSPLDAISAENIGTTPAQSIYYTCELIPESFPRETVASMRAPVPCPGVPEYDPVLHAGGLKELASVSSITHALGRVYFIEAEGLNRVKIGYSGHPGRRMESLSTGCPAPTWGIR